MSDQLKSASEKDSYYVNEDDSEESIDDCDDSYEDDESNEFEEDNNDSDDEDTAFDQLKLELEKCPWEEDKTDFEKVRQIISANKHLLNEPIDNLGRYVLHYACWKNAPSNIVIEFINENPLAVQQKEDEYGMYPLHYACWKNQSESVIQLLIKEYPMAVQENTKRQGMYPYVYYPLHYACESNQSDSVIQLLIKEYPLAVQQKATARLFYGGDDEYSDYNAGYPLHLACRNSHSERLLLVLINLCLQAVKLRNCYGRTPLSIAKIYNQSSTIIKVLEELTTMSDYDLENRIGIPTIVALHGLDNLRRNDIFQWVLYNSPILIDGEYIYI